MKYTEECLSGVVVNVLDCKILVNEFEFLLNYHACFCPDTFGRCIKPLICLIYW